MAADRGVMVKSNFRYKVGDVPHLSSRFYRTFISLTQLASRPPSYPPLRLKMLPGSHRTVTYRAPAMCYCKEALPFTAKSWL